MAISKHEPRGKWSCLIGCTVLALGIGSELVWAGDDEIEIDRANWSNDRNRLTVRGEKAPNNATVTIRYGKKEDRFFFNLSQHSSTSIGHGTLMLRLVIQLSMILALFVMAVCLYIKPAWAPSSTRNSKSSRSSVTGTPHSSS